VRHDLTEDVTCDPGRSAFSSGWVRSLSSPCFRAPRINGLQLERTSLLLRLQDISSTSEGIGCTYGAPGTAPLLLSSTRVSAARVRAGASSSPTLHNSRVSAPTTGPVWVTAIPGRHRVPHAASQTSWPNFSRAAGLPDPSCSSGNRSRVSTSVCLLPITRRRPQVSSSWTPRTKTMHMRCREWRDSFPCCRRPASSDCLASRSGSRLNRSLHRFAHSRARQCSAPPDTKRRPTKSFTFGRPCRKSGARAAGSPFLSWWSPVREEPTRIGDGYSRIKRRCRNEDA
jgi:hypothetical protein